MNKTSNDDFEDNEDSENDVVIVDLPLEVNMSTPNQPKSKPSTAACPYCGLILSRKDRVRRHIVSKHPGCVVPEVIHNSPKTPNVKVTCSTRFIPSPLVNDAMSIPTEDASPKAIKTNAGKTPSGSIIVRSQFTPEDRTMSISTIRLPSQLMSQVLII